MLEDPSVVRLWTIAILAKEFNQLPSVVARDLDTDPEQISLLVLPLLRYADAKAVFDRGNKQELKAYQGSKMMDRVTQYAFDNAEKALRGEA